jgi:hypothetical protein
MTWTVKALSRTSEKTGIMSTDHADRSQVNTIVAILSLDKDPIKLKRITALINGF